ncbi:sugar ABC transporter substrate-binding protein [Streptomyces sp. 35G-GA-8]|uniref:ABC transporter substrate-binding protein n=1 Tax=Streptomyces sp. 35G-GA-8 TaxID=2939434 RepID=UPI00201F72B6|nr:sugar ABC transporter substrate-binding protein [Streptomyces sp. 35G-GA-8]MCL7382102.1 sugar ABC transporter substrate-binding protein [Streptomyces sp. 35G-GA-8]
MKNFPTTRRHRLRPVAAAAVTAALLVLTGCGSGSDPGSATPSGLVPESRLKDPTSPVTITYAGAAYSADDMKPVLDAFHKAHPNITVEYQAVPFDQFNSVLSTRLSRKDSTLDLFDVDMPRTDAYQARGWLTDLSSAFPDTSGKVDKASLEAATSDGKLVTMPYQTSSQLLYYNKDLLKKAGIPFPSAAPAARMTWEQVTADGKKAQKAGADWGLLFDQVNRYYQLQPLAESLGGGSGVTGKDNLTADVENAGWTKAMDWYGSLYKDKVSPRGVPVAQTPDTFASGQVAFFAGGPWWAPQFTGEKKLDFGVAAYPYFEGGKAVTPTGGWSLGLNPAGEHAQAAEIFMKFMALDNGGYAQYMSGLAVPPSNIEGAETFYQQAVFQDPRMAGAAELTKDELRNTAVLRARTVGYVEFEDALGRAFEDIANGTAPSKALSSATKDIDQAWAKYK